MEGPVVLTCILSSSVAAATITALKELWIWKLNRNDRKESRDDEQSEDLSKIHEILSEQTDGIHSLSEHVSRLNDSVDSLRKSEKYIIQDRIRYLSMVNIKKGSITPSERKTIHDMWDIYHNYLGGNGDLNTIIEKLDALDLDIR